MQFLDDCDDSTGNRSRRTKQPTNRGRWRKNWRLREGQHRLLASEDDGAAGDQTLRRCDHGPVNLHMKELMDLVFELRYEDAISRIDRLNSQDASSAMKTFQ